MAAPLQHPQQGARGFVRHHRAAAPAHLPASRRGWGAVLSPKQAQQGDTVAVMTR